MPRIKTTTVYTVINSETNVLVNYASIAAMITDPGNSINVTPSHWSVYIAGKGYPVNYKGYTIHRQYLITGIIARLNKIKANDTAKAKTV